MNQTCTSLLVFLLSFLFSISGYSQYLENRILQDTTDRFKENVVLKRLAAQNRLQTKANQYTNNYDLKYYRFHWTVDPALEPAWISGSVTIYWEAVEPMNTITFYLADNMTVSEVIQREDKLPFAHDEGKLMITLSSTQTAGSLDSLTITYGGNPTGKHSSSLFGDLYSFYQDRHNGIPIVWTESIALEAPNYFWWPSKQSFTDRADSIDIFITHPQYFDIHEYQTASNGVLISETVDDTSKTAHWKHRYPILDNYIGFAITNYTVYCEYAYEGTEHEFPIINYVFPEHLSDVQKYTPVTATIIELYGDLFEMYPYADEKYGHAEIIANYGFENTTLSLMGFFDNREIIAHELAHMWFANKISCASWEDVWLNEGFATYLDLLTREHLDGDEAFRNRRRKYVNDVTMKSDGSVFCPDTTSIERILDYRLTYKKSSMVLHMLRYKLGDEDFFAAVQNYLADPKLAFSYAKTIDLQNHFEAQSDMDLDEFFADWYMGEGHPSYQVQWNQVGENAYFQINQTQSHPSVSFFEMPLPVKVNGSEGETQWLRLENTENDQLIERTVAFPISSVQIDPEYEIISANNSITYSPSVGTHLENHKDEEMRIYPNPTCTTLNIETSISDHFSIDMTSLNGQILYSIESEEPTKMLNVSSFKPGVYFITIRSKDFVRTEKIIKL
jgi:aminopeptidase N